jgi:ubiquinol-cytochrome c reductase cytochrome b subunit
VHVIFLPALLVLLVVLHVVLMRRHGISGPVRTRQGPMTTFYPWQAAKDTVVVALVLVGLAAFAWNGAPPLEGPADPTDATYVPRPEWYFLGLFQLLKYFPGKWEVVGAIILPGIAATFLVLLPWLDRGPERHPLKRLAIVFAVVLGVASVATLTTLGWRDSPRNRNASAWTLREIGGRTLAAQAGCANCHSAEGMADPLEGVASSRGAEWIAGHVADPEMIVPGLRQPPASRHEREVAAIVAYVQRLSRAPYPAVPPETQAAAAVYVRYCVGCHTVDGDGGKDGPDLSKVGSKRDHATIRRIIADPLSVNADAEMPAFGKRLTPQELDAISAYLSSRK